MWDWKKEYSDPDDYSCHHETGEWTVSEQDPYWNIDFSPALAEGETRKSLSESLPNGEPNQTRVPDPFDLARAKIYGQRRAAMASTKEHAMMLAERIANNDHGGGVEEVLKQHGITLLNKSSDWICPDIGRYTSYYQTFNIPIRLDGKKTDKGFLEGVIHPYQISVKYVGKNRGTRWWNLLSVDLGITNQNGTLVREIFWPETATDINAIVTKMAIEELVEYSKNRTFRW